MVDTVPQPRSGWSSHGQSALPANSHGCRPGPDPHESYIPMRDISVIYDADIPLNQHVSCLNSWSNTSTSWVQFLTSWGIPMISKLTFPFNHSFYPCKSTFRHTIDFSFQFFKGWMLHHLPVARTLTPVTPQSSRSPVREVLRRTTEKWVDLSWWT